MINKDNFYGKYFKNTKDNKVKCSCCGRSISKGYIVSGMNLGEDCYDSIDILFKQNVVESNTEMVRFLSLQKMHFDWIKNA